MVFRCTDCVLDCVCIVFGGIWLGCFLLFVDGFGIVLGWLWDGFSMVAGSLWDAFSTVLGLLWSGFRIVFRKNWILR